MTLLELINECEERAILVDVALENESLTQALKDKNDDLVLHILDNEF